jgi:hypothetical protein
MTVAAPYATGRTQCRHHDIIEMPHGPVSIGTCKFCGREREYKNFRWPDYNNESLNRPSMTPLDRKFRREWRD